MTDQPIRDRAQQLFEEQRTANHKRVDRMFVYLMAGQWVFAIIISLVISPWAWNGKVRTVHEHVLIAAGLGGIISSLPIALALLKPGEPITRYVIGCAQMMWSALLIHLTGGRIETHFHVFGSLAFVAFYRDWKVLVPATIVVATDHFLRGMYWPESVYGIVNPEWWRFLEHAFWVVFEDTVLVLYCIEATREMRRVADKRAEVEALSEREAEKSAALEKANGELKHQQEILVRSERLAAVGQLAASVGHELRNPLAAVRNATTYIAKKLGAGTPAANAPDPRVTQFLGVIDHELAVCSHIIADLLDFAREKEPVRAPCPLRPLVEEAISVVPATKATVKNEVPEDLPVPEIDRDQFRQVLVNLIQNACEAVPADRDGVVAVRASGGGADAWKIVVEDNGSGMPKETADRIFEPLFTTKSKGTGLGLAIVAQAIKRHRGEIRVESEVGKGTRFIIDLPVQRVQKAA
jgi:signal transduction histidine kinase